MLAENLVALYETDPDIIASVLPRPLEAAEPLVRVTFARVDMPGSDIPLGAGTFAVKCRHGEHRRLLRPADDHEQGAGGPRAAATPSASPRNWAKPPCATTTVRSWAS